MRTLTGAYRAVCLAVDLDAKQVRCHVPQVFAEETVTCLDWLSVPKAGDAGWVMFESGFPDRPVWLGNGEGGGDDEVFVGSTPPSSFDFELWYDPNAPGPGGGGGGGTSGPQSYVYNQASPLLVWTINHNLGWYPSVTVLDTGGRQVEADLAYPTINRVTITFSVAFSGVAYLS